MGELDPDDLRVVERAVATIEKLLGQRAAPAPR